MIEFVARRKFIKFESCFNIFAIILAHISLPKHRKPMLFVMFALNQREDAVKIDDTEQQNNKIQKVIISNILL